MKTIFKWRARVGFFAASLLFALFITAPNAMAATTASVGTWQSGTSYPTTITGARTVIYNGYIYTLGGENGGGNAVQTVDYASINNDGSLGSWNSATNLPFAYFSLAGAVAYNGYMYIFGGCNGSTYYATAYSAPINNDGSLGSWTSQTSMPNVRTETGYALYNGYIYIVGGYDGTSENDTTFYAPLNSNGSVGTWTTSTSHLPAGVAYDDASAYNGYIYVLGGQNNSGTLADVSFAKINSDGSIGAWNSTTNMPSAASAISTVAYDNYLFLFSMGASISDYINVYLTPINSDGTIGSTWTHQANNMLYTTRISGTALNSSSGIVYIVGGTGSPGFIDSVQYAQLSVVTTASSATTTSSTTLSAPNTGYGRPTNSSLIVEALAVGSIITIASGLLIIYRQKKHA